MGNLYQINVEMARLQERCEWDEDHQLFVDLDTGELMTEEELAALFHSLGMDKHEICVWMAKAVINYRAEIESLKSEKKRLMSRQTALERKVERFIAILDRESGGENLDLEVATLKHRKSTPLEVDEGRTADLIDWLEDNDHDDCVKYAEPELRKDPIKKLIKAGVKVPYAKIADKINASLS